MTNKKICPLYAGKEKCSDFVSQNGFCDKYEKCGRRLDYIRENLFVIDTSDGNEAAEKLVGIFMNSYRYNYEELYEHLLKKNKKIINNFNVLCFKWIEKLAEFGLNEKYMYYDERNEASVKFALTYIDELRAVIPEYIDIGKKKKDFVAVKYCSDEEMADYFAAYLSSSKSCDDFIKKCVYIHRTTQQSFTRFIYRWFCFYVSKNERGRTAYMKILKKMRDSKHRFPMV